MNKRIAITSDCVCDLTDEMLKKYGVNIIYFYIKTDHGWFKDRDEVTAQNVIEYFDNGGQSIKTQAPDVSEYESFFEKMLNNCDEIIHISITSSMSFSYSNATKAKEKFGGRITVFDSKQLSSGIGLLVIRAAELVKEGKDRCSIVTELENLREKTSTSFISENVDYLYKAGRVSKPVKNICTLLNMHPILAMKNGNLRLAGIGIGDYEKSVMRYIKKRLKNDKNIDKQRVFITHASCALKILSRARTQVAKLCNFKERSVTEASATISSNCGANTIGVLFLKK